jgi:hypothetical protein
MRFDPRTWSERVRISRRILKAEISPAPYIFTGPRERGS